MQYIKNKYARRESISSMAKVKILVEGFQCERCSHKWAPRLKKETPRVCPKCHSPYWDRPRSNGK